MRVNFLNKGVLWAAILWLAPAAFSASPGASPPRVRAVVTATAPFAVEASSLIQQVKEEALGVKKDAGELSACTRQPFLLDWHADADQLVVIREQVNKMDNQLAELRADQAEALPWQQQAVAAVAPALAELTNTTQTAITGLNADESQAQIYYSNMHGLANDMYTEASHVTRTLATAQK